MKEFIQSLVKSNQGKACSILKSSPSLCKDLIDDLSGNGRQYYPVHVAAFTNQEDVLSCLIGLGADVDATEPTYKGWTALHFAAQHRHGGIAKLLVEAGANKDIKDNDGKSALDFANEFSHDDIVEILFTND